VHKTFLVFPKLKAPYCIRTNHNGLVKSWIYAALGAALIIRSQNSDGKVKSSKNDLLLYRQHQTGC